MSAEIISGKTRMQFREYMVGWVLRTISDEFDAARVHCDLSYTPQISGARRTLVEQYYHTVDWNDWTQVRRVLGVFEEVLRDADEKSKSPDSNYSSCGKRDLDKLIWLLDRDGFQWSGGRIVRGVGLSSLNDVKAAAVLFDAHHMAEQISRMEASVDSDPSLAIGTAKELIETCCKTILEERGKTVPDSPDLAKLTKETLKELNLVPEGVADERRGSDVIRRILQNLGAIGNGLAELRGLYGTGHGKHGKATSLKPRHAKLAVGAAATLVTFLFETHLETKS